MPKRVGLYARVSTRDKDQDPEVQIAPLRRFVESRGWALQDLYVDRGVSGSKASRPQLDRMMADARGGLLDVVVVWRFDRFARSVKHLVDALEEFRGLGVDFVSQQEQLDTSTPAGKMLFHVIAAMAEFERAIISERVKAGMALARARGKHIGRPRREVDIRPAVAMLEQGYGVEETGRILNVPGRTLRRRLVEAGEWPRP